MKIRALTTAAMLVLGNLTLGNVAHAQQPSVQSPIAFTSSIPWLNESFRWAKNQALQYSHPGTGAMGPWYEAALPGRNAFCMRDVSHQTEGAAALGLYAANKNILSLFVRSSSKSKDWAAYWEIDKNGEPSDADYVSDNDFWFNLPANFDVLDASIRMSRWTGDPSYRSDPAFQRFFRITMTDYLTSWQLEPSNILKRPRITNQKLTQGKFVDARGIPSYSEGTKDFIAGADLLAAEFRAMTSYAQITNDHELARSLKQKAAEIQSTLEQTGWSEKDHHYYGAIRSDLSGYGSADTMILYFEAAKDPRHINGALKYISSPEYWENINIEEESYVPLILFRYDREEAAYKVLENLSDHGKPRREYPEVSYSVIEAIVGGVMGISPKGENDGHEISTRSHLSENGAQATLTALSIRHNLIEVSHTGRTSTRLKNQQGPALRWRAEFPGTVSQLFIAGKPISTKRSTTLEGIPISWIGIDVKPGEEVTVSTSPSNFQAR